MFLSAQAPQTLCAILCGVLHRMAHKKPMKGEQRMEGCPVGTKLYSFVLGCQGLKTEWENSMESVSMGNSEMTSRGGPWLQPW